MNDSSKNKQPLIEELESLKRRLGELEQAELRWKQTEEALNKSEETFRNLIENAPDAIYVHADARFLYLNPMATTLFDAASADQLIGSRLMDRFHPSCHAMIQERLHLLYEGNRALPIVEQIYIRMDGSPVPVEAHAVPITYNHQKASLTFAHDISQRKRKEEMLRESEERYRTILDNIEDGYFEVDIAGNLTFFNDSVCRMTGYSRTEMTGMNNRQYTDKENGKILYQAFNKVFRTEKPSTGVGYEIIGKDRTKRHIESSVSLIRNISGQPIGFRGIMRNITERKRAEQEIGILGEIGRVIGSTLQIDEVYERFAVEAKKLIPFDSLIVNLKKPREDTLDVVYASGTDIIERRKGDAFPLNGSVTEVALRTKMGLIVRSEDILKKTDRFSTLGVNLQAGLHSMMSAPLISRDEAIGALIFRAEKLDAYTEQDLSLAERIGAQIAGAIANAQMFTDLKKTEKSLRESEGRFRALVEQAAVGVAELVMETGRFITVNRRLSEMVGRTEDELLTTTFQAITHPEDLHLHEEKTALLLAGKIGNYSLEKRYLRKDGEIVWVNIEVSPLWKPGAKPGRNMIVVEDITERKRLEAEMREMSLRDLLTDLYNRRGFITLAEQQIRAADRARRAMLLMFIDCDGLKWINDTLGHEEGDRALIDTANVLRRTFRKSDVIARLGGDEFAVLSIDTADINLEDFPKRLQQNIDADNAKDIRPYMLAMSWGTAVYDPGSPLSLDGLMSSADERMYAQKKAKPNRRI